MSTTSDGIELLSRVESEPWKGTQYVKATEFQRALAVIRARDEEIEGLRIMQRSLQNDVRALQLRDAVGRTPTIEEPTIEEPTIKRGLLDRLFNKLFGP